MKRVIAAMAALILSVGCYAQDMIVKKDGSIIQAKVSEIGTSEVKYKKWSNPDGPSYAIAKSDILAITYQNGEKETFEDASTVSSQTASTPQAPQIIERPVAADNKDILKKYDKSIGLRKQGKIGKDASRAVGVFAFGENSVLSNEDIEIEFAVSKSTSPAMTPLSMAYYKKNEHLLYRYCIKFKNKTDKTLYIDLANCVRTNSRTGDSYPFYTRETVAVSHGNTTSVGVGGVGVLGGVGLGLGISGASSAGTSHSYSQERIISIPPHSTSVIRDFKLAKIKNEKVEIVSRGEELFFGYSLPTKEIWGGIQYQEHSIPKGVVKENETINYTLDDSPIVLDYIFTYSQVPDFSSYSIIKSSLYLKELIGYLYPKSFVYQAWLNIYWNHKLCIDDFVGYDEKTIIGPINFGK